MEQTFLQNPGQSFSPLPNLISYDFFFLILRRTVHTFLFNWSFYVGRKELRQNAELHLVLGEGVTSWRWE